MGQYGRTNLALAGLLVLIRIFSDIHLENVLWCCIPTLIFVCLSGSLLSALLRLRIEFIKCCMRLFWHTFELFLAPELATLRVVSQVQRFRCVTFVVATPRFWVCFWLCRFRLWTVAIVTLTSSFDNAVPLETLANVTLAFTTDFSRPTFRFWSLCCPVTLYWFGK